MRETVRRLRARHRSDGGFTLIELLVVVVIIGVLVAIAVPVYLNYRQGAADKSAQSDVRGAITAVEQYYTDNSSYPATATNKATSFTLGTSSTKVTLSANTTLSYVLAGDGASYKICAKNSGGEKNYLYDSTQGGSVTTQTITNWGTCT